MHVDLRFADERSCSYADIDPINDLLRQLSNTAAEIDFNYLVRVAGHSRLLLARFSGRIVGMGTLIPVFQPTGASGLIEDVVVGDMIRGFGLGRRITEELIEEAKRLNLRKVELTSRPERVAANKLYLSLGFVLQLIKSNPPRNFYGLDLTH